MDKQEVLQRLKEGNERFVSDKLNNQFQNSQRRREIVDGQSPFAVILTCADSRVVPEIIFDTGLGELFVVRVAGNVANTTSIASIEYAVAHLQTPVIVVLGHQNCGAVTAALQGGDYGENLNHLMAHLARAIEQSSPDDSIDEIAIKNTDLTVEDLKSRSEILSYAIDNDKLLIIPAFYYLESGKVNFFYLL
jgi:carbonic anhydrase